MGRVLDMAAPDPRRGHKLLVALLLEIAHLSAIHPPHGRPGEDAGDEPFEVVYLDEDRRLPFLLERAA